MALKGKMTREIEIKSDPDLFRELFYQKPYDVAKLTSKVYNCELHKGDWGTHGSIICWYYTDDGTRKKAKQIFQYDDEKKIATLSMIEGTLLEEFKYFIIKVQVRNEGEKKLVSWTCEYEKLNEDIEDPSILLQYFSDITKEIEAHHLAGTTM